MKCLLGVLVIFFFLTVFNVGGCNTIHQPENGKILEMCGDYGEFSICATGLSGMQSLIEDSVEVRIKPDKLPDLTRILSVAIKKAEERRGKKVVRTVVKESSVILYFDERTLAPSR